MPEDDPLQRLAGTLERVPAPDPELGGVERRAGRIRARRRVVAGLFGAVLAAGIAVPVWLLLGLARAKPLVDRPPTPTPPDVARIVCDGRTTRLVTPRVRPQPDGVHIVVDNRTSIKGLVFQAALGGNQAPPGVHEIESPTGGAWPLTPGGNRVRCIDSRPLAPVPSPFALLQVIDPAHLWVADQLQCPDAGRVGGSIDYIRQEPKPGDPVEIVRRFLGSQVHDGDRLARVGYPRAQTAEVGLYRADELIEVVQLSWNGHGSWYPPDETNACSPLPTAGSG